MIVLVVPQTSVESLMSSLEINPFEFFLFYGSIKMQARVRTTVSFPGTNSSVGEAEDRSSSPGAQTGRRRECRGHGAGGGGAEEGA